MGAFGVGATGCVDKEMLTSVERIGRSQLIPHVGRTDQARLSGLRDADPPVEYRFSLENAWSRRLFVALLRRYGLRPYRYHRQRANTVMVRIPRSFERTLWPEFVALDEALREHLDAVAQRVISEAIAGDTSEAEEIRGELGAAQDG